MADDELDETSDENLDDELEESDDESGDETATSETSEDESEQSDDDESDDSTSTDESDDESDDDESTETSGKTKRTPEQIAKYERKRRKKAERELRDLKRGDRGDAGNSDTKLPPGGVADRFWKSIVKVDIAEIAVDDPTVHQRAGIIKKIIFDEMPELQKKENGVSIANDIAKGRMLKATSEQTEGQEKIVKRKTSPTQPRRPADRGNEFKPKSQAEVNKMSSEQLQEYEDQLGDYYVKHPEARNQQ